ncbi:MAG: hypothetical protein ACRDQ5_06340 [Sciscionella sp.]
MLLMLVSACAQESSDKVSVGNQPAGPPKLSVSRVAPPGAGGQQEVPKGGTPVAAAKVDAASLPSDYPHRVWTLDGGQTLAAYGQRGGCSKLRLEVAVQDAKQVTLRFVEKVPDAKKMCTLELHQLPLTASLGSPLGDREVVLDAVKQRR